MPRLGVILVYLLAAACPPQEEDPPPAPAAELPTPRLLGPRHGAEKDRALRRYGGSRVTEQSVEAGLDWLERHQSPEGLWDADGFPELCKTPEDACDGTGRGQHGEEIPCPFDAAISALAVLAFLGHGHLPDAAGDRYGDVVGRALERLRAGTGEVWALPLTLLALAEAETMERRGRFRVEVGSLADSLLSMRQPDGAFGYAAPYRPGSDVPFSALAVQALMAAADAGCELPADLGPGVDGFLDSLECKQGQLAYIQEGREYGYTPTTTNAHLAAAIRELLEVGTAGARHRSHLALIGRKKPVWKIAFEAVEVPGQGRLKVQLGSLSLYQWWYGAIATFHHGGGTWDAYFRSARTALTRNQRTTGCARGSWDPLGTYERQTGGRVFATALGVLILEQPYRQRRR